MPTFAVDLLAQSKRLLGATTSDEVLALTCHEAQRLAKADPVYGSVAVSAEWAVGMHRRFRGAEQFDARPPQRSALFAVQRAVSKAGGPVTLEREDHATIVDALFGSDGPATVWAFPIVQAQGRRFGCLALCPADPHDAALRDAIAELASLAALALDTVQRVSSARHDRERLRLLSEAAEEALWDWSPATGSFWWGGGVQTLIGDVVIQSRLSWKFEQIHPEDVDRVRQAFQNAVDTFDVETWRGEYRLQRSDGEWRMVEEYAHILRDSAGRAYRVVGAMRDVTELRSLLERERAARLEAEGASLAKDEFLAMLGHELRNPLSPIVTALHLLRKRGVPEAIERILAIIERQARHLTRLVDDLLDVARIANGKVLLERERIDLASIIDTALETANPLIEERRHGVEARIARGLLVDADRARMQQVIGNLITNAAKYTPPGGRIVIEGHAGNGWVQVRVADTGIGISAEMLPTIFDTFVQARQTIERTRGGLGLGLAIVRNLVRLHGGEVEVRSEGEGKGSAFLVRLPAAEPSTETEAPAAPVVAAPDIDKRILIVDDNKDAAESLAELLDLMGCETRVVHDGPAALSIAHAFEPEVILLDIGLPVMDGYEVARRLRRQYGARCPRLIAVTGYGQKNDRMKTEEAGFDLHLVKPVSFERVRDAIDGGAGARLS